MHGLVDYESNQTETNYSALLALHGLLHHLCAAVLMLKIVGCDSRTDADNAENGHDTRLPGSPVLSLDQLTDDRLASHEGVDGGHVY